SVTPSFSADDKTFSASNSWDNWATYKVEGNKTFDLSSGFTFNWDMGVGTGNAASYNEYIFLTQLSIGDLTIKSQRNNDSGTTSTITVYNGSTVITRNASVPNSNKVKNYSMTVADGRLTLSVTYNNETTVVFGGDTAVDVSTIDFSAAKFTALSSPGYSGGFEFKINQLTYKTEVPDSNNFVVTKDGQGFVKCNGKNWIDRDVAAGTQVTLTAEAAYGYTFQGWVNGVNNTVVSTDPTLTVRANTTNNYTAVFVKNSGKYTVTVLNRFGKVVGTPASVAAGGKYTLPAAVDVTGYTFQGWQVKDSEDTTAYAAGAEYTVTGNVIFVPVYDVVETPTTYNISVTGGTADKANANYNELVTVTATVENFGYWTKNGVVVSYSSTYSFYAGLANGTDINLVAVADTASAAPVTSIVNVYGSTAKVTFLMERSVPDDYSLVESGFILAKAAFGTTDYMSAVNGSTVIKVAASNTSANGQYMLNVKTTSGNAIYAVSYVTYVDASGKLHTVYSSAASANAQ
ncbi:MAG: InlB B-repeat-containing protein, partial [Firmicutes bacterium]|nr:InlB B-repeat-containing protein [Bacillota bacterium]